MHSVSTLSTRFRFGRPTVGNCVAVMVDGKDTFEQMYDRISTAEKSILIANYDLDPGLKFARSYPDTELSRPIKSACKTPFADARIDQDSRTCTLKDLLVKKARQGVDVKVIVWQPRLALRILPGADERGINSREDDVEELGRIARKLGVPERLQVRVDSTAPAMTSAHHEKIVVIDGCVGFCGGLDLSRGKWDVGTHDYESSLRDPDSEPWHDVHAMVKGPVVWDLACHFWQRWFYAETRDREKAQQLVALAAAEEAGHTPVTALRTWKEMDRSGGISAWYAEIFRKAEKGIYIENQFPFQTKALTRVLAKRLKEARDLRVVIVGPMEPNLPGFVGSMIAKMSVKDVDRNLALLRKASGGRLVTFSLVSQHKTVPTLRRQIYVHSKLMIADDRWMTLGSANLDKNGLADSTELNLGITSKELAAKTRLRLWMEHTGVMPRAKLEDFGEGFEVLKRLAEENGERVAQGRPIAGSIYFYNFEEEGLPPPYPDAGNGKSRLL